MKKKLITLGLTTILATSVMTGCSTQGHGASQSANSTTAPASTADSATTPASAADATSADTVLSGNISTNGSTSMEKLIGILSEQFMIDHPDVTITYDPTGSGTGIESAKNGSCDIGLSSRSLKAEETGLTETVVALDGIAVIVNANCGVDDLSVAQITDIFTGVITNWSEVGGADLTISCIGRESGSGTRDGFESVTGTKDSCVLAQELTSTGAVISAVSGNENAIGYASLSATNGQTGIKTLTVEGVACSEETISDGTYKVQRPFVLVTQEGTALSSAAQAFYDYATSAEAADLIRQAGAVPAK